MATKLQERTSSNAWARVQSELYFINLISGCEIPSGTLHDAKQLYPKLARIVEVMTDSQVEYMITKIENLR